MGEAKWRKLEDPNFGKIKKRSSMRGLIISSPMQISNKKITVNSSLDPQDLRFSLFFWDRLSWPQTNTIRIEGCDSAKYLETAGILERPRFHYYGDQSESFAKGYLAALTDYDKKSPGMWALGSGINSINTDYELFETNAGTIIELQHCIPIPQNDVPLPEILEFRQRRRDELLVFRQYLDDIASEIGEGSDSVDALQHAQKKLDDTCRDLFKVTREWQRPIHLTNFKAGFNIDLGKATSNAFKTWSALGLMGLAGTTAEVGAVLSGISSQISIKGDLGLKPYRKGSSPFKYAYSIEREFL